MYHTLNITNQSTSKGSRITKSLKVLRIKTKNINNSSFLDYCLHWFLVPRFPALVDDEVVWLWAACWLFKESRNAFFASISCGKMSWTVFQRTVFTVSDRPTSLQHIIIMINEKLMSCQYTIYDYNYYIDRVLEVLVLQPDREDNCNNIKHICVQVFAIWCEHSNLF
jgi:hypothetical protein